MGGGLCENIFNDSFRQFPGALILFPDNLDPGSRFNIGPVSSDHLWPLLLNKGSGFDGLLSKVGFLKPRNHFYLNYLCPSKCQPYSQWLFGQ
jgi:hypothetical protein